MVPSPPFSPTARRQSGQASRCPALHHFLPRWDLHDGALRFWPDIARNPDGSGWFTPSAVSFFGTGVGFQIGIDVSDHIFVINNREAIENVSDEYC